MKHILIIIALMLAGGKYAHAGTWGVQWHIHSMHFEDRAYEDWTEGTDGFGLRYSLNDTWSAQAGHYRNEFTIRGYNFFTNYAGVDYTPLAIGPIHFGGYGWLTSGYNEYELAQNPENRSHPSRVLYEHDAGIRPAAGLIARLDYRKLNLIIRLHPDLPGGVPAAVMSEVGYSF